MVQNDCRPSKINSSIGVQGELELDFFLFFFFLIALIIWQQIH
jgi:hypothetical protein